MMSAIIRLTPEYWLERFPEGAFSGEAHFDEPMSAHTTLRLGGPADAFIVPADVVSFQRVIKGLTEDGSPLAVVGAGSNLVVRDGGITGAAVSLSKLSRLETLKEDDSTVRVFVEAGAMLGRLVRFCAEKGLTGMEGLAGIPGTVGGAIRMNAGSYGCEMRNVIDSVVVMSARGSIERVVAGKIPFAYRDWGLGADRFVIGANLVFGKSEPVKVLNATTENLRRKRESQPIAERSAGCVFKNPPEMAAWRLIDEAGMRGAAEGAIAVSAMHANFFINTGGGTTAQFVALMERVAEAVEKTAGVRLEPEVKLIGQQ
ncbi:MAG: UDP-N-acetylmuramate dehydrogenase [Nitrospirae bacterium]|nr:UDP-N-acetylmuramate dehydrogenase [Nitrospirota bacterium]